MVEFDLVYRNIRLRVVCCKYIEELIKKHFQSHIIFEEVNNEATYSLIISDNILKPRGNYYKMIDKWFDNATLDCYIDNKSKICYATNFQASTKEYRDLLIQYFSANLLNRFLEINGYYGVHSSCVEKSGSGVLFVAGRNSGKTVCMLNLMAEGFNSVTNDKIALKDIGNDVVAYGIAQSVSIRLSPQFCSQPENQKYVDLAMKKGIEIKNQNMLEGNNMVLNDVELANLNNVSPVIDTSLACIVRPFYDSSIKEVVFKAMPKNECLDLVKSQYMSLVHDTTFFLRDVNIGEEKVVSTTLNRIADIPCYYCYQNENTREDFVEKVKQLVIK